MIAGTFTLFRCGARAAPCDDAARQGVVKIDGLYPSRNTNLASARTPQFDARRFPPMRGGL